MRHKISTPLLLILALGLQACGDDESGDVQAESPCIGSFAGADISHPMVGACSICNTSNEGAAVDGDRSTFAEMRLGAGSIALRATKSEFPEGSFAGALMHIPAGYNPQSTWTFTTYLDGVPVETRNATNAAGGDPSDPVDGDDFYGFIATLPFDAVEIGIEGGFPATNTGALPQIRIYEFCGAM